MKRSLIGSISLGNVILAMLAAELHAGTFTAFGPKTFIRETGKPVVETVAFNIKNPNTTYTMHIHNGGINSELARVSSAIIKLNSSIIFDTNDFNQRVSHLQRQVSVTNNNLLEVELRSIPDSGLTILLEGVDNDLPTITTSADPQPNSYGWYNQDATVTFTCDDATSGIAECPPPAVVTNEGREMVISGTAVDLAGNSASVSITINMDKTLPTIDIASPQDGTTINNAKPDFSVKYSDGLSGIDTPTAEIAIDGIDVTDGAVISDTGGTYTPETSLKDGSHAVDAYVSDIAGNTVSALISFTVKTKQRPFIFPEPGGIAYGSELIDINRDGILDAVGRIGGRWGNDRVVATLGKGDAQFEKPSVIYTEWSISEPATGDINGDSYPDIILISDKGEGYPPVLMTFLGNGDGTFTQKASYNINYGGKILLGNFDGDALKDIVIVRYEGASYYKHLLFRGKGDGTFDAPVEFSIGTGANEFTITDITLADLNNDGLTDMAVSGVEWYESGGRTIIVQNALVTLIAKGDGTFRTSIAHTLDDSWHSWFAKTAGGDFNGDGLLDVIIARYQPFHGSPDDTVSIFGFTMLIGDGNGGFTDKIDKEIGLVNIWRKTINVKDLRACCTNPFS